jgi:hypothetical protein
MTPYQKSLYDHQEPRKLPKCKTVCGLGPYSMALTLSFVAHFPQSQKGLLRGQLDRKDYRCYLDKEEAKMI